MDLLNKSIEKNFCLGAASAADIYREMKELDKSESYAKKAIDMPNASSECIEISIGSLALTEFYKIGVIENEYQKKLENYAKKDSLISQTSLGNLYYEVAEKNQNDKNLYAKAAYWYEQIESYLKDPGSSHTLPTTQTPDVSDPSGVMTFFEVPGEQGEAAPWWSEIGGERPWITPYSD